MQLIKAFKRLLGKRVKTPKGRKKLNFAFYGYSGKAYYYFPELHNDINVDRYYRLYHIRVWEFYQGIGFGDLQKWIEATRKFNDINQYRQAVEALNIRTQITLDTNILYELMACLYIREDEENELITNEFLNEKANDIKKAIETSSEGLGDFFLYPALRDLLNTQNISLMNFNALASNLEAQAQAFQKVMEKI